MTAWPMSNFPVFGANGAGTNGFRERRIRNRESVQSAKARTGTALAKLQKMLDN
jgi:hypothetical protein